MVKAAGARRRRREGAHLARHQAARAAIPSRTPARSSKGQVVTCEVLEVKDGGLEVKIGDTDLTAFIKRDDLARDRDEQRPERFAAGEKVDARVTQFDRKTRRVTSRSRRWRSPRRRRRSRSTARPIPAPRSATSSAPRSTRRRPPRRSDAPPGASSRARRKPRPTPSTERFRPRSRLSASRSAGMTTDG